MIRETICSSNSVDVQKKCGKSRNLFNKLRIRSKSVVNLNREKSSSPFSWFSRKTRIASPEKNNEDEKNGFMNKNNENGLTAVLNKELDRRFSASHSNLQSSEIEINSLNERKTNEFNELSTNASTSKMPSYVNISLVANGYSKSRTNLNNIFSRSGDVHNLMIDDADVTDLNKDYKSVIFVNNAIEKTPKMSDFSYLIPQFEVGTESVLIFKNLNNTLEELLNKCVENSEIILKKQDISEDAREAILVASGHTRVLLKSKIKKMKQLIDKHMENTGEVTLNDLGSFWTMMDIEVAKIREQFEMVEKYRENNWKEIPKQEKDLSSKSTPKTVPSKSKPISTNPRTKVPRSTPSATPKLRSNVKDFLAARRKELANSQKAENGCNGEAALITIQ